MGVALLFPGQAAQFVGMAQKLTAASSTAKALLEKADDLLGYSLSDIMFNGPVERLTETIYTQPAVFLHSMLVFEEHKNNHVIKAVAGHSLGEISACVAAGVLSFEDGLLLVQKRAEAMQKACDLHPSTMAAVLGLEDQVVEEICASIEGVVPANYNCPGQLVISGTKEGISQAVEVSKEKGARRALEISVGGAFHSPLMQPALDEFREAIMSMDLKDASVPVYRNVDALPHQKASDLRQNLIDQVVNPVRWTALIQNMAKKGHTSFVEVGGKGNILKGMLRKISRELEVELWREE